MKSSLLPLAIKLSLPCSAFELVSYTNNTGFGQGHPLGYITSVLVHLLLSIVDPIPALRPIAVDLDALFVELLIVILVITVHNPVTVGRTSILLLLLLRLIRFLKVHRYLLLLHHVVTRKMTCGFRERALGNPITTLAHFPVRSGASGYPTPGCTKSPAP